MESRVIWSCLVCLVLVQSAAAEIPDYIKTCYKSDPHINQCINSSIEALKPKLRTGIDELNVPGLEPLIVKELKLRRGPKGALFEATVNGLRAFGASDFTITELESDLEASTFDAKLLLPLIRFEGDYQLKMNILLFSVRGKGYLHGNFTNYRCDLHMKGNKVQRAGATYLEFEKMKFKLNVGDAKFHFSNLFNGDPALGSATNRIINENSSILVDEILPLLEDTLAELFTEIANSITLRFEYKELFL